LTATVLGLQAAREQVYVAQPESGLAGVNAPLKDLCLLSIDALSGCHADICGSQSSAMNFNAVMELRIHHLLDDSIIAGQRLLLDMQAAKKAAVFHVAASV
jgi:hypothetical protein